MQFYYMLNMDELENIVLGEINQIQRDKYFLSPLK